MPGRVDREAGRVHRVPAEHERLLRRDWASLPRPVRRLRTGVREDCPVSVFFQTIPGDWYEWRPAPRETDAMRFTSVAKEQFDYLMSEVSLGTPRAVTAVGINMPPEVVACSVTIRQIVRWYENDVPVDAG